MWNPIKEIYCKYLVWKIKKEDPTFVWTKEDDRRAKEIVKMLKAMKPILDPEWGNRDLDGIEDSFEIPGENQ